MSFSFQFPSSSTPLGPPPNKTATGPAKTAATATTSSSSPSFSSPSNNPAVPDNLAKFLSTSGPVPAAAPAPVQRALYCRRRHGQVIEVNFTTPSNVQVNLVETAAASTAATFSPSKFLYSLKSWPVESTPKRLLCNSLGNLMAIQGSSGNISVLRLQGSAAAVTEEIELEQTILSAAFADFAAFAWHPASPADHHLVVLGRSGKLFMFDILRAIRAGAFDEEAEDEAALGFDGGAALLRLSEPEQLVKLPTSRTDPFSSIAFSAPSGNSAWALFTAFLARESGDIFALCPLVPLKFRAQRQNHLLPLKQAESEPVVFRWLDEIIRSCEFVANSAGDTDWVLATCPASFSHLQPRLQGPFLIQPEPMEIHHLASYDRVVDFSASAFRVTGSNEPLTLLAIAFGSGKVDFLAVATEIVPKFQLKDTLVKSPHAHESDVLPILALIESVDLKGSEEKSANRRSTDNPIKFLEYPGGGGAFFLVSTETAVIKINLRISCDESEEAADLDWSIACDSTILIEKLKSHVLCASESKIYPGAITLDLLSSASISRTSSSYVRESSILETITKFAFPLGKMEIEGGAVQLDGLLENLTKTCQRLKAHRSISSTAKLPEIDEIGATEFNDHVSEWQEALVSPAIRVGHEIALRSRELVQILGREREILVRAKTLLTAKPERLEKLLKALSEANIRNQKLSERVQTVSQELAKHSPQDAVLLEKLAEISRNLRSHHPLRSGQQDEFVLLENEDELVQAQLAIQTEKLLKLKNQLSFRPQ